MRECFLTFTHRLAALFRRRRLEDDLDEELRSHLEMAVELNVRKGMTPEDARVAQAKAALLIPHRRLRT